MTTTVPIKDSTGHVMCTVHFEILADDDFRRGYKRRCRSAQRQMRRLSRALTKCNINADGTAADVRSALPLSTAERKIEKIIAQLVPLDNPAGLFETRRPFACIKGGGFYCERVLTTLNDLLDDLLNDLAERRFLHE